MVITGIRRTTEANSIDSILEESCAELHFIFGSICCETILAVQDQERRHEIQQEQTSRGQRQIVDIGDPMSPAALLTPLELLC